MPSHRGRATRLSPNAVLAADVEEPRGQNPPRSRPRLVGTQINRIYNRLQINGLIPTKLVPPSIRYGIRTALASMLVGDSVALPPLRPDVDRYSALFADACGNFERLVRPYSSEPNWPLGRIFNGMFESVDAMLYYSILRQQRPRSIIEIGTGNSAWFAFDAIGLNGLGHILAVDPAPRFPPPREIDWLKARVQDVPLTLFEDLVAGDVLFIDSSHRADEVEYHLRRILPVLAHGVLIHVHDFHFPFESEYGTDPHRSEETDAWLGLLSAPRAEYRVITCAPYVRYARPDLLRTLVPSYARTPSRPPWSLWVEKNVA